MVAGAVVHEHGVLPELGVLLGQDGDELGEVGHDDRLVGVGLRERDVGVALRVEAADDIDVMSKILIGLGVLGTPGRPLASAEVQVGAPTFIDADDPLLLGQQPEHLLGVVLSQHERSIKITNEVDPS